MSEDHHQALNQVEIVQILRSKDPEAFARIYEGYRRRVSSVAFRMSGRHDEAEDAVQEVFIQLYRKGGSFRGESAFGTWLFRLTVNTVLMRMRKNRCRGAEQQAADIGLESVAVDQPLRQPGLSVIERMHLSKSIGKLPKGYRQVLLLHDLEGYEHEEIASILGVSPGTTKSQLHKARTRLRRLLTARLKPGRNWIPQSKLIFEKAGRR